MPTLKERLYSLLRWSEKYTKTDMVYLASGGFLSLISQGTALVGALVLAIMVSHYVPKTSYGEYKYILSIVAILSSFSLNGIGLAVLQSSAQGYGDALEKGFWANLRWSFFIFGGALVLALYYLYGGNTTLAAGVLIGGTFAPFLASASLFSVFLAGKKDFVRQTLFSVCDSILPVCLMIGTVLLTSNPLILVAVYFISNTLAALYFYRRTQQVYANKGQKKDDTMLTYSKHLSVMGIMGGIAENIDQVLLFHFVGVIQLAVYNFATAIPDQMRTPTKTIDAMLQARFVSRPGEQIQSSMTNKFLWYFISAVSVTALYILIAPYIYQYLFPNYLEAVKYSQLYALWIITLSFDPAYSYISSRKILRPQYVRTIALSVSQILFMVVGVLWYGIVGIIVARILSRIIVAFIDLFYYLQNIKKEVTAV